MLSKILSILILIFSLVDLTMALPIKIPKKITYNVGNCQNLINHLDTCKISTCSSSLNLDNNKIIFKYSIIAYADAKCLMKKSILSRDENGRPMVFSEECNLSDEGRKVLITEFIEQSKGNYKSLFSGSDHSLIRKECKAR